MHGHKVGIWVWKTTLLKIGGCVEDVSRNEAEYESRRDVISIPLGSY